MNELTLIKELILKNKWKYDDGLISYNQVYNDLWDSNVFEFASKSSHFGKSISSDVHDYIKTSVKKGFEMESLIMKSIQNKFDVVEHRKQKGLKLYQTIYKYVTPRNRDIYIYIKFCLNSDHTLVYVDQHFAKFGSEISH